MQWQRAFVVGLSSPRWGWVLHAVASKAQRVQLVSYYILEEPKY